MSMFAIFVAAAATVAAPAPLPDLSLNQTLGLCVRRAEIEYVNKVAPGETVDRLVEFLYKQGYSEAQIKDVLKTCHSFEVGRNYQRIMFQGPRT